MHSSALPPAADAVDLDIRKQAIARYVRLCSGEATQADREECETWLRQDARHRQAWGQMAGVRDVLRRVPGHIALPVLDAVDRGRRDALRRLGGVASLGLVAVLGYRSVPWREWTADHRTGTGERQRFVLVDGSELWLNSASAVDVRFDHEQRLLRLQAGELLLRTAHADGEHRPLIVETVHGRIQALGTRFLVALDGARTRVSVLEHAVSVRPRHGGGDPVIVHASHRATFDAHRIDDMTRADRYADAWIHGQLIVDDRPLGEVVAELARHRRGLLRCDPAVAGIRVSGVYPLDDIDTALATLARRFPVRIGGLGRYWTVLEPA